MVGFWNRRRRRMDRAAVALQPTDSLGYVYQRASIGCISAGGAFVRIRMSENPLSRIAQIAIDSGMIHSRRRAGSSSSGGRIAI